MKKSGFTLMELMVYIAIMGIVVLVAGQAFSDSTKMRVRTQNMIAANQVAENVASLLKDDIAQMGAKSFVTAGNKDVFALKSHVYMDPDNATPANRDSSSFNLTKRNNQDSLTMRRIKYTDSGVFESIEEIAWFVKDGKLYRSLKLLDSDEEIEDEVVEIAKGVSKFSILPAKPGVLSAEYASASSEKQYPRLLPSKTDTSVHAFQLVPRVDIDRNYYSLMTAPNGATVILSSFATNYDFAEDKIELDGEKRNQVYVVGGSAATSGGAWNEVCTSIDSLQVGVEYEIKFDIPFAVNNTSRAFCPGRDHMSVGFRYKENGATVNGLDDFLFYPPAHNTANTARIIRFSPQTTVKNICMAFTFVSYSPLANSSSVTIENLELNKVESSNYVFDESYTTPNPIDKKNIKAIQLQLQIKKANEAGEVTLVIPVPSNGIRD